MSITNKRVKQGTLTPSKQERNSSSIRSKNSVDSESSSGSTSRRSWQTIVKRTFKERFHSAFKKSIAVRKRNLGRKLTSREYDRLKRAVAKQCRGRRSPRPQSQTSSNCNSPSPTSSSIPKCKHECSHVVEMIMHQFSLLKLEFYRAFDSLQRESVFRPCYHPTIYEETIDLPCPPQGTEATRFAANLGCNPKWHMNPTNTEALLAYTSQRCCSDCKQKRSDYLFENHNELYQSMLELKAPIFEFEKLWSRVRSQFTDSCL
jgi:hypothetical protein